MMKKDMIGIVIIVFTFLMQILGSMIDIGTFRILTSPIIFLIGLLVGSLLIAYHTRKETS